MEEIYTFAGNPLDRVSQRRQDAGWIASLLDDPETRLLPLRELKPVVRDRRRRNSTGSRSRRGARRSTAAPH